MPLHRSLLFWFGLFILSFLVWAWADSRSNHWSYTWYPPGYRSVFELSSGSSEIVLICQRFPKGETREYDFREVEKVLPGGASYQNAGKPLLPEAWFPQRPLFHFVGESEVVAGRFGHEMVEGEWWRLAWWVLIAGYLPLWLGLALWRARRIARARRAILGKPGAFYVRVVAR